MSSSVHVDNKRKDILILGKGPTQGLSEHSLSAEKMYSINFTKGNAKFYLRLHYNGANSSLSIYELFGILVIVSECECDKLCDTSEYLHYGNFKCRKRLIGKLVEGFTENVEEIKLTKITSAKMKISTNAVRAREKRTNKSGEYGKDFMEIKLDLDDSLTLNETLKVYNMTICCNLFLKKMVNIIYKFF